MNAMLKILNVAFVGIISAVLLGNVTHAQGVPQQPGFSSNNPLHRLQQLSRRVQQKYSKRDPQEEARQRQLRSADQRLYQSQQRAATSYFTQRPSTRGQAQTVQRANPIGVAADHTRNRQTAYAQHQGEFQTSHQPLSQREYLDWPAADPNLPTHQTGYPTQQHTSSVANPQLKNSLRPDYAQSPVSSIPQSRDALPSSAYSNAPVQFQDPGIVGVQNVGRSDNARFRHFSSRIPASERVVILEDELGKVEDKLRAKELDNQTLQRKLQKNEQLLAEIQSTIDETIAQLTAATQTNQQLRQRVAQLELENQQQKADSERLINEFDVKVRNLVTAALSEGK